MCFENLYDSAKRGELLLVDGGMCRYHLRRDGQLTIHELISLRPGAGLHLLTRLCTVAGARFLLAKCPADLESNTWYARRGFVRAAEEATPSGRRLNTWVYWL